MQHVVAVEFAELYRRERAFVRGCLVGLGVPAAAVDDGIQETFVEVLRAYDRFDAARGSVRAWLFGFAIRIARRIRSRRCCEALPEIAATSASDDPERRIARRAAAELADQLLQRIPRELWLPILMTEVEGLSAVEVAAELRLPVGTVYSRIHRGRAQLARARRRLAEPTPWWAMVVGLDAPRAAAAFVSVRLVASLVAVVLAIVAALGLTRGTEASVDDASAAPESTTRSTTRRAVDAKVDGASEPGRALRPRASMAGRITADGRPLAGADVCAWRELSPRSMFDAGPGDPPQPPLACVASGHDGRYRIDDLDAARVIATATAHGRAPARHHGADANARLRLEPGRVRDGVDIDLSRPGIAVAITVVDMAGGIIEGAALVLTPPLRPGHLPWDAAPGSRASTDANGAAEIHAARGPNVLRVSADGYATAVRTLTVPTRMQTVALAPESTISGRVVDGEGNGLVAEVVAFPGEDLRRGSASAWTDDDGAFRLVGLGPGEYRVRARAPGFAAEQTGRVVLGVGEHEDHVVLRARATVALRGHVVVDDGRGCAGGSVSLSPRGTEQREVAAIDELGEVAFAGLLPGPHRVIVDCIDAANQIAPMELSVSPDMPEPTWQLRRGTILGGRVLDGDERPVAGLGLCALATEGPGAGALRCATSADDGSFAIDGLAAGRHELEAERTSALGVDAQTVDVPDRGRVDVVLHAAEAHAVTGRVVDAQGVGVAGAVVVFEGDDASTQTDATGAFAMSASPGTVHVVAHSDAASSAPVGVTIERRDPRPITLVLERGVITGRVVDHAGTPVAEALVTSLPTRGAGAGPADTTRLLAAVDGGDGRRVLTDADGRFSIDVGAGPRVVVAHRRGGGRAWRTGIEAGVDVTLQIDEDAALVGTVRTIDGGVPHGLRLRVHDAIRGGDRDDTFTLSDGAFEFSGLRSGPVRIAAWASEGTATITVELVAGHTARAEITLAPRKPIRGRFVDWATGEPVAGIVVVAGDANENVRDFATRAGLAYAAGAPGQRSGPDGSFALPDAPGTRLRIVALGEQLLTGRYWVHLLAVDAPSDGELVIGLAEGRRSRPMEGAEIDLDVAMTEDRFCADSRVERVGETVRAAGIAVGDRIVALDGHDVDGWRCYLIEKVFASLEPGERIAVGLGDGRTVTLRAGDR